MMMTSDQARALAALISTLRTDWDPQGIFAALGQARDRGDAWELAHAALRAAAEPKNRTPAVIAMAGPHWQAPATVHELRPAKPGAPMRDDERCPVEGHRQQPAAWCSLCRGQYLGGDGWPEGTRHVEARRFETAPAAPDYAQRAAGDTD